MKYKVFFSKKCKKKAFIDEWQDMPEFVQNEQEFFCKILVRFDSEKDLEEFSKVIKQNLTINTKSIWYPKLAIKSYKNKRYVDA